LDGKEKRRKIIMKIKKALKIIILIILILLITIIALKAYSQKIIFGILDAYENYRQGDFSYRETQIYNTSHSFDDIIECIRRKNIYVEKHNSYVEWFNLEDTDELYNHFQYELTSDEIYGKTIFYDLQVAVDIKYRLEHPNTWILIYYSDIRKILESSDSFIAKIISIANLPIIYTRRI